MMQVFPRSFRQLVLFAPQPLHLSLHLGISAHTFTCYTNNPNGSADQNPANDQSTSNFTVTSPSVGTPVPFWQGFNLTTFPPTGWTLENGGDPAYTWVRTTVASGFDTSTASTRMDNYSSSSSIAGDIDALETPAVSFASVSSPVRIDFSVASCRYNSSLYDRLKVYYSTDCGNAWVSIYDKSGSTLATAPDNTNAFDPTSSQWRRESVNIDVLAGNNNVMFRFENISGWGNYLYIDDVNMYGNVSVPAPVANFSASSTTICQGTTVNFTDLSTNTPTSWSWTFNGGTPGTSTAQNPSVTFNTPGSYTISLTATNGGGSDGETKTNYITVNQAATSNAGSDATICQGSTYTLAGSIGGSATGATWTTSGTGTFSNPSSLTATYTPSASDITMGNVTLTLTTNDPAGPCPAIADPMVLTINAAATSNAGSDAAICAGSTYTLAGSIGGSATSATWTTSGTGTFSNPSSMTATYTPSATDISMGNVTLTLTTNDPSGPCPAATDQMAITINPAATVNAGSDASICSGSTYTLSGSIGGSASGSTWTTSGSGTFNNASLPNAIYTPSATDITMGSVTLTLTTNDPAGPCPAVNDAMILIINAAATVNAGSDATVCAGTTYTLSGIIGGGATSATWTTSGTGTFNNPNSLTATYSPSASDITMGSVTLTLTTNDPAGPCPAVNDQMVITINAAATANAGSDAAICAGSTYTLSGSFGGGASSAAWTTSGSGTFNNPASMTATYTPSATDISMGTVTLTLTTNDPAGPCTAVSDAMILTINAQAQANAGTDATVCSGNTYTIAGATIGGSASSQLWTSSGSGSFNNPTLLNTTYTPSATDISAGTVTLTITTNDPAGPCPAASDLMILTINPVALANAGSDSVICQGSTYTLSGTVGGGATGGVWTTSGSGTFNNPNLLTATYTPSVADITAGIVTLTLTTNDPSGPCPAASDQMILNINSSATVFAGADGEICAGNSYPLSGTIGGGATGGSWSSSGTGVFNNPLSLTASYTPSAADISIGSVTIILTTNDPAGPCPSAFDAMILTINPLPVISFSVSNVMCYGNSDGSVSAIVSDGTPAYSYLWNTTPAQTASNATGLSSGSYTVTITDSKTCSSSGSVSVTQPLPLTLTDSSIATTCGSSNGIAMVTAGGGTGGYTYQWDAAAGSQTTSAATGLAAGTYSVTVSDNNGCTVTGIVPVNNGNLSVSVNFLSDVTCYGLCNGSATASASGGNTPYTYEWSSSESGTAANALCGGIQTITVTDNDGCVIISNLTVAEPPALSAVLTDNDVSCYGLSDGSADVAAAGGTPGYSYQWDASAGSQTTSTATGLSSGTFSITVSDANLCSVVESAIINQPGALSVSVDSIANETCSGSGNGFISVLPAGGVLSYSFQWSVSAGSQTTSAATGLSNGLHGITVTDGNGCTATLDTQITTIGNINASIISSSSASCSGAADGSADVSATGGVLPYTYLWSPSAGSQTTSSATGLAAGIYYVTVTDAGGCSDMDSVMINASGSMSALIGSINDVSCFGADDGSVTAIPSGGTTPYSFLWNDPLQQTTQTATGLSGGLYYVTVSDLAGCSVILSATVKDADSISIATSSTNATCGQADGTATVYTVGGVLPYTYAWNDPGNQTTTTATGLLSGFYNVTVSDSKGCTVVATVLVNNDIPVVKIYSYTNVTCAGACNGTASTSLTGGVAPFTFIWFNGSTTGSVSGLCAVTVSVTVTDANGCITSDNVTLVEPPVLTVAISISTGISCYGSSDGSLTASGSGGVSPYSFSWNDPLSQTTATVTGLSAGIYRVTITDSYSCIQTDSFDLTQPVPLSVLTSTTDATCGSPDGTVTASVIGGTQPYYYLWDDPSAQTGSTATGLSAGSYNVTVTDNPGCTGAASAMVNNTIPQVSVDTIIGASCTDVCDGISAVTASGGTPPYTYLWDNGEINFYAVSLCPGLHQVTVLDSNSCISSATMTIGSPDTLEVFILSVSNVTCNGMNNGIITVTASGGTAPYSYQWNDPLNQTASTATGLSPGNYYVTVADNNGCIVSTAQSVSEPAVLIISISSTNASCGVSNGTATANPSGGTPPYSYQWNDSLTQVTQTATSLSAGNYSVTVTDAKGCTEFFSISIFNNNLAAAITSSANASCSGLCDGSATVTVTSGSGPFTYLWDNGENTSTAFTLCAGPHTVSVTDINNCMTTAGTTIFESIILSLSLASSTDVSCNGFSDGSLTVNLTGGIVPYSYQWDDPGLQTSVTATGLSGGTYQVTVSDVNSCTITGSFTVNEPAPLNLSMSKTDALCGQMNGTATANVSGGVSPYQYAWNDPMNQTTVTATGLAAGGYSVTVSDNNSCTVISSVVINNDIPVVNSITDSDISCNGSCDGSAAVFVSNGTPPYTYLWNNGETTAINDSLCPGSYFVTVNDASGCMTSAGVNITEPVALMGAITSTQDILCGGSSDGIAVVNVSGGTPGYLYQWDLQTGSQTTSTATGLNGGIYSVTVSDSKGCTVLLDSIMINEPAALTLELTSTNVTCIGSANGFIDALAANGVLPYTFSWSTGDTTDDIFSLTPGLYILTLTDRNNCSIIDSAMISEPLTTVAISLMVTNVSCKDSTDGAIDATLNGGTPPYFYTWSNGSPTQDLSGLAPGVYDLIATDANGCTAFIVDTVKEPDSIILTLTSVNITCFGAMNGSASVSVAGGTPPYFYLWSDSPASFFPVISILPADKYFVTVTDDNGCSQTGYVFVQEPEPISLTMYTTNTTCNGVCNGSATSLTGGGTGGYTYLWDASPGNQTSAAVTGLCAGIYRVTVTDENNCSELDSGTIGTISGISLSNLVTPVSCDGSDNGKIDLTVSGGTLPLTYSWNTGDITEDIINLDTGIFIVSVRDSANCFASDTIRVTAGNDPCFLIYDAFSPNNDGANDTWIIRGIDKFPAAIVEVYNRWGSLVFRSQPYTTPWDGRFNGKDLPEGVYYYIITTGTGDEFTGTVTIVR
ncbi:MAG: gliding motility-associated C-terminal domain-containing protein [Bacteroidetes bacterium]|nr:gliding motility-associated C-terminal domain-containing protein [Bacteroidota bacterium]